MAVTISFFDSFIEAMGDNTIDMDAASNFKIELCNAYTFSAAHTQRSDWSGTALATGNGYTNPGLLLTSPTWGHTGSTTTFDAADASWTAATGDIGPATDAIIYADLTTVPVDAGVCAIDFGGSQTAGDGTDFKITFNASGIFTIS